MLICSDGDYRDFRNPNDDGYRVLSHCACRDPLLFKNELCFALEVGIFFEVSSGAAVEELD